MDLESALKLVSEKVWNELEPVNGFDINIHEVREEGLSSMALKTLAKTNCKNVLKIDMIGATAESERGYDFEICIGNSKKKKFVRYFIQAKRLYGHKLNSSYGAYNSLQTATLETYSKKNKGIPLYALFNHLTVPDSTLIKYYNSVSDFKREYMGITVGTSTKLKAVTKFDEVHTSMYENYYRNPFYRYHPNDIKFYEDRVQAGIPFHDLARFSIDEIETINKKYKENKKKNLLPFFFFFFADELAGNDGEELYPILKMDKEELHSDFLRRSNNDNKVEGYNPKALLILEEEGKYE